MTRLQTKKAHDQNPKLTPNSRSPYSDSTQELTFLEHVYELRKRLFWVVLSLIAASSVGYYLKDHLVNFIIAPLHGEKLIYLTPGGGFSFIFTVCLYFGALLTIPVVMYHIYRFLQPVLGKASRRFICAIVLLSGVLAVAGAVFGYAVAIPGAISFLTTFAGDAVNPSLTAESYLGFVVAYILGLAALFQLPLLLFMFDHVRPFPPGALLSSQRFVIVGSFIAAAIITPTPDIINQMIVAVPIIVIYQLGAVAVFLRRQARQRTRRGARTRKAVTADMVNASDKIQPAPIQKPIASAPLSAKKNSTSTPALPLSPRAKPSRSIDGITSRQRNSVATARPLRGAAGRQTATRSLDGFSMRRQSTRSGDGVLTTS